MGLALLAALHVMTLHVGARVVRSMRTEARLERGNVRVQAPPEARVHVEHAPGRVVVTIDR
jgi:hypothetical protein